MTQTLTSAGEAEEPKLRLDLGCGPNKKEGHFGIDCSPFPGVDLVIDLGRDRLPFDDGSVDSAFGSHFLEHLTATERCHLINELYRVLKPNAQVELIVPHWASCRAYGDPTHQWPPISEMFFFYLDKNWRTSQAPHTDKANWEHGYDCDFTSTWGYTLNQVLHTRNKEFQEFAVSFYKEAIQDLHITMTKRA